MDLPLFIDKITLLQRQTLFTLNGIQTIERLAVVPLGLDKDRFMTPNEDAIMKTIDSNLMVYYCKTPTSKEIVGSLLRIKNRYIPALCEEFMPYARHGDNILLDVLSCITKNEQREKAACAMINSLFSSPPFPETTMVREENQSHPPSLIPNIYKNYYV